MQPQPDDAILDKIRKVHALAERAGTEAEAAVAAALVQQLLAKHNLALGEVVLKEDPGVEMTVGRAWRRIPSHAFILGRACDDLFDVRHFFRGNRGGRRFVFLGLKANVEAAAVTYDYLMESVEALVRGAKAQDLIYGTDDFLAFRLGASERIRELARQQKAETLAANPGYGELVHLGKALAQDLYDAIEFSGTARGGGGAFWSYGTSAYSHGYDQGSRVDLAGARTSRMLK